MELPLLEFEPSLAQRYKKSEKVLAFRSGDAFVFRKSWGVQKMRGGSWIIVPLKDGQPTPNVYGCDENSFRATYNRSSDGAANTFEKHAQILAYQPGKPFAVRTALRDGHVETNPATGGPASWLVRNPTGEIYPVDDLVFRASYCLVT